jgi:hypothetical protein
MKIKITESQLKKLLNEVGGYDDQNVMNLHAQNVQSPLLQGLASTVEVLNSFLQMSSTGSLNKEHLKNYISNLTYKLDMDINMIESLKGEIYLDDDFKSLITDYETSLKKLKSYLRLLYSEDTGLLYDMTENELIGTIVDEIEKLQSSIEPLVIMFQTVHGRYRDRLGIN